MSSPEQRRPIGHIATGIIGVDHSDPAASREYRAQIRPFDSRRHIRTVTGPRELLLVTHIPDARETTPAPFHLDTLFSRAKAYQVFHEQSHGSLSRTEALTLALEDVAYSAPFGAAPEDRHRIEGLGVPGTVDPVRLFDYVSENSGIPKADPFDSARENPAAVKFDQARQRYAPYRDRPNSSMPWAGAMEMLEQAWQYHERKPRIEAEIAERDEETRKDRPVHVETDPRLNYPVLVYDSHNRMAA